MQTSSSIRLTILAALACCFFTSCAPQMQVGGLPPGEKMPKIEPAVWINGPPPKLDGKVVVIDAWSTRCKPCVDAMPKMYKLHQKFSPRGVVFLGIVSENLDPRIEDVTKLLKEYSIEYPNAYGASQAFLDFRIQGIPQIWVVGRNGVILWNRDAAGSLEAAIEKALAK